MEISRKCANFVTRFHSVRPLFVLTSVVRHRALQSSALVSYTKLSLMAKIYTPLSGREILELNGRGKCKAFGEYSFVRTMSTMSKGESESSTLARPITSHSPQESKLKAGNGAEILPEEHYAYIQSILDRLHRLEETLHIRGYSVLRWGLGLVVAVGLAVYMFREPLKENVADEIADVASRSLADESVVNNVNEMTKAVLQDIVNNPETAKLASSFVTSVLNREDVRQAAVALAYHILGDPGTQERINKIAIQTFSGLLQDERTRNNILELVKLLILDASTKASCQILLRDVLRDPETKDFVSRSLAEVVTSSIVTDKAVELGKSVTHEVVSDTIIQHETGDAMWRALKHSFTPWWIGK